MNSIVKLRLTSEEKERWQRAADAAGVSLSEWVRRRCESGLPSKEIRVVTIDPEEVAASTIVCVPPSVGKWVPLPEEPTVHPCTVEVEPMVESIPPIPTPKVFDFSRCIQPRLLCQFRNMPLCGPCKELNQ